uniref:UBX domain protein 1 n=1 Tax=Myotis myotis TaxID=51298 RepID=A0A7J7RI10_MYOMY|nr:UBX domain protein 1 [Myotis myotis]
MWTSRCRPPSDMSWDGNPPPRSRVAPKGPGPPRKKGNSF